MSCCQRSVIFTSVNDNSWYPPASNLKYHHWRFLKREDLSVVEVKVAYLCLTLCDPVDCSLPVSSVHGILQAGILEWVAIAFSRGSSQLRNWTEVSCLAGRFFTNWTTREAQEYWNGQPIPSVADLPNSGIKPESPALQVDSLPTKLSGKPNKAYKAHQNWMSLRTQKNSWRMKITSTDKNTWQGRSVHSPSGQWIKKN